MSEKNPHKAPTFWNLLKCHRFGWRVLTTIFLILPAVVLLALLSLLLERTSEAFSRWEKNLCQKADKLNLDGRDRVRREFAPWYKWNQEKANERMRTREDSYKAP